MQTLKDRLEDKKNEIGLVGIRLNLLRPKEGKGISEHITHDWKELVIRIKEDINLAPDQETKDYLQKRKTKDPVETVATDLLFHGCGHREIPVYSGLGCPYTVEWHDRIKDGVAKALKEKGKQGLEGYVTNAFEDLVNLANVKNKTDLTGQVLFWNNEALENENKFTEFYEAFVKLNLLFMGSVEDATLLRRFYSNSDKVKKSTANFKRYLQKKLNERNIVRIHSKPEALEKLFDKEDWTEMAYEFAKSLADLLEDQPKMRLCFGVPVDGETYFDELLKLPGTQEEVAFERFKKGLGPSEHTEPLTQLDALYRKISKIIPVKTSEYTKANELPIAYFGRRNVRKDEDIKIARIKGIGLNENGDLTLKTSRHEIKHSASYKTHPKNFPRCKVALIDTSGSMACNVDNETGNNGQPINIGDTKFIPWGDNSKYHFALKGIYGIDNYFEAQGISPYVQSQIITISDRPERTIKGRLRNEAERKKLLRKPSGGTKINSKLIEESEKSFLISISDGDVANWHSEKEKYRKAIEGSDYCHIHIGSSNEFTRDLENWGVPVKYVKGDEDLSRLMIDVTSKYYREGNFN